MQLINKFLGETTLSLGWNGDGEIFVKIGISAETEARLTYEEFRGDLTLGFDDVDGEFHVGVRFGLFGPSFEIEMCKSALFVNLYEAIDIFVELDGISSFPADEFDSISGIFFLRFDADEETVLLGVEQFSIEDIL